MQSLTLRIYENPSEAPNYNELDEKFSAATLEKAVIVRNGTEGGSSTVDLIFRDENGKPFIAMITGRLLKSVTDAIGEE